jgi:hypothetical protein
MPTTTAFKWSDFLLAGSGYMYLVLATAPFRINSSGQNILHGHTTLTQLTSTLSAGVQAVPQIVYITGPSYNIGMSFSKREVSFWWVKREVSFWWVLT